MKKTVILINTLQWQQGRGYREEKTRVKILQGDKVETMD
jgi:hypothetical protein